MCAVSNIGDQFGRDYWEKKYPTQPFPFAPYPEIKGPQVVPSDSGVSRKDFDDLRKEVMELKELLLAAKKFDEATGQPNCEIEEKVEILKKVAELVGVDLSEVFGNE